MNVSCDVVQSVLLLGLSSSVAICAAYTLECC